MSVCVAQHSYAAPEGEKKILSFHEGDEFYDVQFLEGGWWYGTDSLGNDGYFPSSFVTIVSEQPEEENCIPEVDSRESEVEERESEKLKKEEISKNASNNGCIALRDDATKKTFYFHNGEFSWELPVR